MCGIVPNSWVSGHVLNDLRPNGREAMANPISFQSIPVLIDGHDTQGVLVMHDGDLVAVLARLDGEAHDREIQGRWHLEAGFGPCQEVAMQVFATLDDAGAWAQARVEGHALAKG
jgi:hypothetical protein